MDAGRAGRVRNEMADYLFVPQAVLDKWSKQISEAIKRQVGA